MTPQDRELEARVGRGQEAMGQAITYPMSGPGLTTLDARMPRDRGPDDGRHMRNIARLAGYAAMLPPEMTFEDSPMGRQVLSGMSILEREDLLRELTAAATPQAQVTDALVRQSFNTQLSPQEETQFATWKQQYAPRDSGQDYDLRGAFKAGLRPDHTGHWPDTFKKPSHPTFSTGSIYAPHGKPGVWHGEVYTPYEQRKRR